MTHFSKLFILVFLGWTVSVTLQAQELISTAGGGAQSSSLQVNWSIGENIVETFSGSNISLTQGFHQSRLTVTSVDLLPGLSFKIQAFPNPATDYVTLAISAENVEEYSYVLTDIKGRKLLEKPDLSKQETIDLHNLPASSYLLSILFHKTIIRSFTIIKQ